MGSRYNVWQSRTKEVPRTIEALQAVLRQNRSFEALDSLAYGDYGLHAAQEAVISAIQNGQRIALYADYDVDGTMSCVSWIWFFKAIGFHNYIHYIPCRFKEGYGLNLDAMKHLIHDQGAELIITMDTGITANKEAAYCKEHGVGFICTDHHKIQQEKMPDSIILNPKMHPHSDYQELCGCGITFVLLRTLGKSFEIPAEIWTDILALAGMATICDVVPLNPVNHKLAKLGVQALVRSQRPVLRQLCQASAAELGLDEQDVGFRIGPRINAVGRLEHADKVVEAFVGENPETLIAYMERCNKERRAIQARIVEEAMEQAKAQEHLPILFLGGDWHPGVVGIAASKLAEHYWKPVWLFQRTDSGCKGSARSIPGFDVTEAMAAAEGFGKFGGHQAAGGYSFELQNEDAICQGLIAYAQQQQLERPAVWQSVLSYDCSLDMALLDFELVRCLDELRPFGHGFEQPVFCLQSEIVGLDYYNDKATGLAKHSVLFLKGVGLESRKKVLFFNQVLELEPGLSVKCLVTVGKNHFRGRTELAIYGKDLEVLK